MRLSGFLYFFLVKYTVCARLTLQLRLRRFAMLPKGHMISHEAKRLMTESKKGAWVVNTIVFTNQVQEDFIGRPSRLSRRVNIKCLHWNVLCRALIIYQDEFYKSDHDLRGLDAYGDLWCKIFFQLNQFRREAFGFLWVTPHPCCICLGPGLLAIEFEVGWTKKRQGKWAGWVEKEQPPKSCKIQKTVFLTKGRILAFIYEPCTKYGPFLKTSDQAAQGIYIYMDDVSLAPPQLSTRDMLLILFPMDNTSCSNWSTWLFKTAICSARPRSTLVLSLDWSSRLPLISLGSSVSSVAIVSPPTLEAENGSPTLLLLVPFSMAEMTAVKLSKYVQVLQVASLALESCRLVNKPLLKLTL